MKKYILLVSRVGAYIIDYMPYYLLLYLLSGYGVWGYLFCLVIFFVYRYVSTALWGATIGMILLKLELTRYDFKICFKREILRFASAFFYVGYIYAIFDPKGCTFHDIISDTLVKHKGHEEQMGKPPNILKILIYIILIISITKWSTSFLLNDIGEIGLHKTCSSEKYYQSFDGDNLISLDQNELYAKTLGRKYTAIIEVGKKPYIVRIANKLKFTEVYKLNIKGTGMLGEYLYRLEVPLQYICSGLFRDEMELCGISPNKEIILADEKGKIFGSGIVSLSNILSIKCGDIDGDKKADIVILGKGGDIEVFSYKNDRLYVLYNGKIGEDIIPEAFFIDKEINLIAMGDNKMLLYSYRYVKGKFVFIAKKNMKQVEVSSISKINNNMLISNISRANMMMKIGRIQTLEMYTLTPKIKRLYNFGNRPSRIYKYSVKNLEGIYDINGDGKYEIVLKSVDKDDVMGQGYKIEIYTLSNTGLAFNRVLSVIQRIFPW
jgi:hypothetical protein